MKREDFVFTIGFEGDTAVIDGRSRKRFGSLNTLQLAEQGLYRQAFCSALYSEDEAEMNTLLGYLRENTAFDASSELALKRLFGVFEVPRGITRTLAV